MNYGEFTVEEKTSTTKVTLPLCSLNQPRTRGKFIRLDSHFILPLTYSGIIELASISGDAVENALGHACTKSTLLFTAALPLLSAPPTPA